MAKKKSKKRTKKPNCTNSFPCGFGCISRSRTCRSNVDDKGNKLIETYTQFLSRTTKSPNGVFSFETAVIKKSLGSGEFGEAQLTENNEVIKIGEITKREIEALIELGPKGLSPKLLGFEDDPPNQKLAMSLSKGKPVLTLFDDMDEEELRDYIKSSRTKLAEIHRAGWAHNDAHDENILYDKKTKESNIIDFGLASKRRDSIIREAVESSYFSLIDVEDRKPVLDFEKDQAQRIRKTALEMLKDGIDPLEVKVLVLQSDILIESNKNILGDRDIETGNTLIKDVSSEQINRYLDILYEDI